MKVKLMVLILVIVVSCVLGALSGRAFLGLF